MSDDRCDLLCLDLPLAEELRRKRLEPGRAEVSAARAAALADPTRLMMAASLRDGGELCVCDLAWISGRAESLVSHHLRRLRSDGLVSSRREGKMVIYSLTDVGRDLIAAVLASGEVAVG
ncbi:MAG: helix-turn-helix transcriptional regulator [Actinobacteria bacterium]|nr:helix-turn-helix transcriptional regulator [Actinomycetota bacterium]OJU86134.1 MAG: transcriptional regulator [Solirubrobacterales bacterium 70-9]